MLFMNKTLLRLARGLWFWILAIAGVSFLTLVGTTALAEIIAGFLGSLFEPQEVLSSAGSAIRAALLVALFTFCAQMVKGLLEYKTAAKARTSMRRMIFSKVLDLDAGGIEKIGPVSAITASVDAVEQMQMYFSTYLPSLICSILAARKAVVPVFTAADADVSKEEAKVSLKSYSEPPKRTAGVRIKEKEAAEAVRKAMEKMLQDKAL